MGTRLINARFFKKISRCLQRQRRHALMDLIRFLMFPENLMSCGWQFEVIFRISGVWHVGWWNLITSVRLIQVGNNGNDYFRHFLGVLVRLIEVSA